MRRSKIDYVEKIREMIENGNFATNGKLPPERELSKEFGISRSTLRKSLSALESQNIIWRCRGRGTFIGQRPDFHNETQMIVRNITNPAEIMEVRILLEPKIAALAALNAKFGDLEEMSNCLKKSENAPDTATYELWDGSLHYSIAKATGNFLLISIFKAVNSLRQDKMWGQLKKASLTTKRKKIYNHQHRSIIKSINDRDIKNSEKFMYIHLKTVQKHLLKNTEKNLL
jgi:DNA-binding FadR family transcriptional regulator